MSEIKAAVIQGDGVGPEMIRPALDLLKAVGRLWNHFVKLDIVPACGETIESCSDPLPEESLNRCKEAKAVLFGNSGLEKYRKLALDKRPEYALLRLRRELGVTTNIRPVSIYRELSSLSPLKERQLEKGVDIVFVRDIVGGVLCSPKFCSTGTGGREAYEREYYNEKIVLDTADIAFRLAGRRGKRLISLDKANVLESSRLWRTSISQVGSRYPQVKLEHCFIDTAAMRLIAMPWEFDTVVTSNLFGDIIADEGAQITGTPRLYASAEISSGGAAIYTPNQLHEADESLIGKDLVNPIGMIQAAALMLNLTFGLKDEAEALKAAVVRVLEKGYSTRDLMLPGRILVGTRQVGELIEEELEKIAVEGAAKKGMRAV